MSHLQKGMLGGLGAEKFHLVFWNFLLEYTRKLQLNNMHLRKYCTKMGYVHMLRSKVSWGSSVCTRVFEGKATSNTPVCLRLRLNLYLTLYQTLAV